VIDLDKGRPIGVLLLNLGGPDSMKAVRQFLYNLFSDREIIRLGAPFMQRPLASFISIIRAPRSRQMYAFIGGRSPINEITMAQADALERLLNGSMAGDATPRFRVYVGMRYWYPFIGDAVQQIRKDDIKELVVLSLYPHYSRTTTGSAISEFKRQLAAHGSPFIVRYIDRWHDFPPYIDLLADMVYNKISDFEGRDPLILYSAHSIPLSFVEDGDPYPEHIRITIEHLNRRLSEVPYNLRDIKWQLSYQSKIGRKKWLGPSTEETIINLAREGCRDILIVPLSFVSDNIETLYEIGIYYRDIAIKHGLNMRRLPSFNTSEGFIKALGRLIREKSGIEKGQS